MKWFVVDNVQLRHGTNLYSNGMRNGGRIAGEIKAVRSDVEDIVSNGGNG